MNERLAVSIRWLLKRDLPEVLAIEASCFPIPWSTNDFVDCLSQRNIIGFVAECNQRVVGFMVLRTMSQTTAHIIKFAVAPDFRRHGVGSQLHERIVAKLPVYRRHKIIVKVRESNLAAQLFCKAKGFQAIKVVSDHYDEIEEDAYLMRFQLEDKFDWHAIADGQADVFEVANGVTAR